MMRKGVNDEGVVHDIKPKRKMLVAWIPIAVILMFVGYVLGLNEAKDQELQKQKAKQLKISAYWRHPGDVIKDDSSADSDYRFAGFIDANTILIQEIHPNQEPAIVETYYQSSQNQPLNIPVKGGELRLKEANAKEHKILLEVIKNK